MKRIYKPICLLWAAIILLAGVPSCKSVKGYEKKYLSHAEMDLSSRKSEKFDINFQSYREGAAGANGGKTGGGCGCN